MSWRPRKWPGELGIDKIEQKENYVAMGDRDTNFAVTLRGALVAIVRCASEADAMRIGRQMRRLHHPADLSNETFDVRRAVPAEILAFNRLSAGVTGDVSLAAVMAAASVPGSTLLPGRRARVANGLRQASR